MPALNTTIGPWTVQTFTLVLVIAITLSGGFGLWQARHDSIGVVVDTYLAALVGAVIGGRLIYVMLNLDYFSDNLAEAFNLAAGGLDWHGAVIGGLIGLYGMVWLQRRFAEGELDLSGQGRETIPFLLDTLTPALAVIGLAGWYGCLAAGCGYGREVDTLANYSPLVASELADVFGIVAPRYNTPFFGMALCILALVLTWRGRFWLILALLSVGMFAIGFFRGDYTPVVLGLRADQWLDVAFAVVSGWLWVKRPANFHQTVH
jgi:phosphatidylglycerol---prolipoprotein diacylglyceryl transferase